MRFFASGAELPDNGGEGMRCYEGAPLLSAIFHSGVELLKTREVLEMSQWKVQPEVSHYFITTTVTEWQYVFTSIPYFEILIETLEFCI
ncbi:MAG: hypothetical protein ACE5H0_08490, partial [Bacteroidota bacterium]